MFIACVQIYSKLCYSFRISLYSTPCYMICWLCEPLSCRKKTMHSLIERYIIS